MFDGLVHPKVFDESCARYNLFGFNLQLATNDPYSFFQTNSFEIAAFCAALPEKCS